jgi:hypothetical protein
MSPINQAEPITFEAAHAMIENDPALQTALDRVNQLDFGMLKRKMIEEHNWAVEFCEEVESLYRRFLALNVRYPDSKIFGMRIFSIQELTCAIAKFFLDTTCIISRISECAARMIARHWKRLFANQSNCSLFILELIRQQVIFWHAAVRLSVAHEKP